MHLQSTTFYGLIGGGTTVTPPDSNKKSYISWFLFGSSVVWQNAEQFAISHSDPA